MDFGRGQSYEITVQVGGEDVVPLTSSTQATTRESENGGEKVDVALQELGEEIRLIAKFIRTRSNLHKELKVMAISARKAFNKLRKSMEEEGRSTRSRPSSNNSATQTSPGQPESLRRTEKTPMKQKEKRKRETPPWMTKGKRQRPYADTQRITRTEAAPVEPEVHVTNCQEGTPKRQNEVDASWSKVARRKTRKKRVNVREIKRTTTIKSSRPDAIKINVPGGGSTDDVLQKVRANPNLKQMGERVT